MGASRFTRQERRRRGGEDQDRTSTFPPGRHHDGNKVVERAKRDVILTRSMPAPLVVALSTPMRRRRCPRWLLESIDVDRSRAVTSGPIARPSYRKQRWARATAPFAGRKRARTDCGAPCSRASRGYASAGPRSSRASHAGTSPIAGSGEPAPSIPRIGASASCGFPATRIALPRHARAVAWAMPTSTTMRPRTYWRNPPTRIRLAAWHVTCREAVSRDRRAESNPTGRACRALVARHRRRRGWPPPRVAAARGGCCVRCSCS